MDPHPHPESPFLLALVISWTSSPMTRHPSHTSLFAHFLNFNMFALAFSSSFNTHRHLSHDQPTHYCQVCAQRKSYQENLFCLMCHPYFLSNCPSYPLSCFIFPYIINNFRCLLHSLILVVYHIQLECKVYEGKNLVWYHFLYIPSTMYDKHQTLNILFVKPVNRLWQGWGIWWSVKWNHVLMGSFGLLLTVICIVYQDHVHNFIIVSG